MAFRELTMIDVKEVLRRWSAGQSDRKIGREAGADRKTVARHTAAATRSAIPRRRAALRSPRATAARVIVALPLRPPIVN
jgi:hypothetical protein